MSNLSSTNQMPNFLESSLSLSVSDSQDLSFPCRLFLLLKKSEEHGMEDVISWNVDGKGFKVHDPSEFEKKLLAQNFKMKKYSSFTRQLCAYGFSCVRKGRQPGLYYHPNFTRSNPDACYEITRGGGKGYAAGAKKMNLSSFRPPPSGILKQGAPNKPKFPSIFSYPQPKSSFGDVRSSGVKFPPKSKDFPSNFEYGKTTSLSTKQAESAYVKATANKFPSLVSFGNTKLHSSLQQSEFVQNNIKFPSLLNYAGSSAQDAQVFSNLYSTVRQRSAWNVDRQESGRISPESSIRSNKSRSSSSCSASISSSATTAASAVIHPFENASKTLAAAAAAHHRPSHSVEDVFEPIPLSRMEETLEKSTQVNDCFNFEPRPIEDMLDQPNIIPN